MLELENLTCGYGAVLAASNVDLAVEAGQIVALVGPNGAGKTSTLMAAMGHVRIVSGVVRLAGRDLTRATPRQRPRDGMAIVPEGRQVFGELTVNENLTVGGTVLPVGRAEAERERVFALFPRLAERRRQPAGSMSGGEQQMLAIGRALMTAPKVLLVDELSLGLMPKMVDLCLETMRSWD